MEQIFKDLIVNTNSKATPSLFDITDKVQRLLDNSGLSNGMITLNCLHTSASLIIQENYDPDVQIDLINFYDKIAPMNPQLYLHTSEGKDDMPAHIKTSLTNSHLTISFRNKRLLLGTWQGIYLFEHRLRAHSRTITVHIMGQ